MYPSPLTWCDVVVCCGVVCSVCNVMSCWVIWCSGSVLVHCSVSYSLTESRSCSTLLLCVNVWRHVDIMYCVGRVRRVVVCRHKRVRY